MKIYDTIVIGGGQAGLSASYFLRRHMLDYLVLDDQHRAGGSWLQTWDSLKLFSPVSYSSMSGWMMPKGENEYPTKDEFLAYMEAYEKRYGFPIQRPTEVLTVSKEDRLFKIGTDKGIFHSKTLISATGTAKKPFIPKYPNNELFTGKQLHSVDYRNPDDLVGKKALVVGGGNSGAQILAEVSKVAEAKWVTLEEPYFLPEDIDGRYLFDDATRRFYNQASSLPPKLSAGKISLSSIVQVKTVMEARKRQVFTSHRPFKSFYENGVIWEDNNWEEFDVVIWCTGFKANLKHLESLKVVENDRVETKYTRSVKEPDLWLLGYGGWTGFASSTIYGVGKTARQTVEEIAETLNHE